MGAVGARVTLLTPYQPRPLAREVVTRVVTEALRYALSLPCAPTTPAEVQAYLIEFDERVDVILAPFEDHAEILAVGEAIKRGARSHVFAEVPHLFNPVAV